MWRIFKHESVIPACKRARQLGGDAALHKTAPGR
jgi:hypothetical protein